VEPTAPPATEEAVECPLCHDADGRLMSGAKDRYQCLPGEFAYVRCRSCSFVWLSPRPVPAALSYYYPEDSYYSYQQSVEFVERGALISRFRQRIRDTVVHSMGYPVSRLSVWQRALQPVIVKLFRDRALYSQSDHFPDYQAHGRALDIGCGSGQYLSLLRRHGWQVAGVELSKAAAATAKHKYDIDVFVGSLREAPFGPASFDFIHMSHVLEHFYDPTEQLQAALRLLKSGGRLYIETPNVESLGRRYCGSYWFHMDAPRHLCLFSPITLRHLLDTAGARVLQLRTFLYESIYRWEDTYRREEEEQATLSPRPQIRLRARPRAAALSAIARLDKLLHPLNGDIISCWAIKP
jgi:SAM-dependent methyltransferase